MSNDNPIIKPDAKVEIVSSVGTPSKTDLAKEKLKNDENTANGGGGFVPMENG